MALAVAWMAGVKNRVICPSVCSTMLGTSNPVRTVSCPAQLMKPITWKGQTRAILIQAHLKKVGDATLKTGIRRSGLTRLAMVGQRLLGLRSHGKLVIMGKSCEAVVCKALAHRQCETGLETRDRRDRR